MVLRLQKPVGMQTMKFAVLSVDILYPEMMSGGILPKHCPDCGTKLIY